MPEQLHRDQRAEFVVVEYLFDVDGSGLYSPKLRVQLGERVFYLVDRQSRKYRELNDALKADFEMAHRWHQKYAPGLALVVSSHNLRAPVSTRS